ncbi:MAG: hypothetical protein BGP06_17940 [Rhizobiales bacterium 65-9]|nr:hypothetical protein [Hyphomicrobiales bacterium]OJY34726.1 MAG: hypothetical protein BGP06_17940 [Rhizobiales bacterium 65-9]
MTSFKKILTAGFAVFALVGAITVTHSTDAEAQWRRGRYYGGYGYGAGAAAAAGIVGGLALGAMAAQAAQPRPTYIEEPRCYRVRRNVWSEYQGRYVVRRVTVCD